MNQTPTEAEIQALLGSARRIRQDGRAGEQATPYDFRRPDRVSQAHVRSLQLLHERFARNVSSSLSAYLRTLTELSVVSARQLTYAEFLQDLPDPTAFYAIAMSPLDGVAALELNPGVAFAMIGRMLGGNGHTTDPGRALTEIEQNIVDGVVGILLDDLADTWKSLKDVEFRISGRETRPQMRQVAAPHDTVLALAFDVRINDHRGALNFCIPAQVIESIRDSFAQTWPQTRHETSAAQRRALARNLAAVRLPIVALLETSLSARELMELQPGDVLSLGKPASHPVRVQVGRTPKFEGHLARRGTFTAIAISAGPAPAVSVGLTEV
ncbi:MAG: flagellar motor switch protein FliM [Acidobacteriota bacterium]